MVKSLKCEATKCVYNKAERCNARTIHVGSDEANQGSDTFCGTYNQGNDAIENDTNDSKDITSKNNQETNEDLADLQDSPKVDCNATSCSYNADFLCYANDVKILGENSAKIRITECSTYNHK